MVKENIIILNITLRETGDAHNKKSKPTGQLSPSAPEA
jgi:hypothetical protein